MKKLLQLLFLFVLTLQITFAQNKHLWATASDGGSLGYGTILKADSSGTNFQAVAAFNYSNGSYPQGKLLIAPDHNLYGATRRGSIANSCVLYNFDTTSNSITKIYDFMSAPNQGAIPYSGLILADDCELYGVTFDGGANSKGVIYFFDPVTNFYADIYDFVDSTGGSPFGDLLQLNDGYFYGLASSGGQNGGGTIFRFDPMSTNYTVLHHFNCISGCSPAYGNLIQATNNKLYGLAYDGGSFGYGAIFSYDPATGTYADLHNFNFSTDGGIPFGSLMQASNGKLYGMTITGGSASNFGTLFSYDITTGIYTVLTVFNGPNGAKPQRGLTQVSTGKLFGTTMFGGLHNDGVIFSYDIITNVYTKVLDFDSITNGAHPTCDIFETGGVQTNPCLVSVPQITRQSSFSIYPNPVPEDRNNFMIRLNSESKNVELKIFDTFGQLIYLEKIEEVHGNLSKQINLRLAAGMYVMKMSEAEKTVTKKFVVE